MKVKKIEKEVYVTDNGKEFFTQKDAADYESLLETINKMSPDELKTILTGPKQISLTPEPLTTQEQKNVSQLKMAIMQVISRNSRMQASPEAILGNLIMELQDLIK